MAFAKELIVCVVFVAVVVKSFPRMYEENAAEEDSDEEQIAEDIDRNGHGGGHDHPTHSYHHFFGPVAGHHEEIAWKDKHGHHHHDYKAHPKYKYSYGVDDHHTKDHHGQKEHRDGKHVEGEYHIHEPGGNVRSVKYHADPHGGFYAEVHNYGGNDHSGGTYGGHKHR
ncbi:histidine-rich glycoprotein-like isoform X2 [Solenopsis invicta]|uniref:histidine-rich glycoprotein-like isoform X2 n=1 Tax=Solenopsis invicta TaxID=13686 RepID=UPI00193DC54E|nr:histidine-rich glycoprotein-like isoform X2 [Solenopsis invicta]